MIEWNLEDQMELLFGVAFMFLIGAGASGYWLHADPVQTVMLFLAFLIGELCGYMCLARRYSILQEASDRHRAYAARDRSDRSSDTETGIVINVADDKVVTDLVDPNINDGDALLDEVSTNHVRPTDSGNNHVSP